MITEFVKRSITAVVLSICFGGAYLHSMALFTILMVAIFVLITVFELPNLIGKCFGPRLFLTALVYPGLPIAGLLYLNYSYRSASILLPLYPVFIAWTADTFGYMVGKFIGKHKICPTLSPGKSWEGLVASFGGVVLLNYFLMPHLEIAAFSVYARHYKSLLIISFIQTIIAFLGGIFISFLKRRQGLKDAGSALPGHGGFLDRFDSVFSTVFVIYGMIFFHAAAKKGIPSFGGKLQTRIQTSISFAVQKVRALLPFGKKKTRPVPSMPVRKKKRKERVIPGQKVIPGQSDDE